MGEERFDEPQASAMSTCFRETSPDGSESDVADERAIVPGSAEFQTLDGVETRRPWSKTEFHPATVSSTALAAATNYYLERGPSAAPDEEDVFGARLERQVFGIADETEDAAALSFGRGRRGRQRGRRPAARLAPELEPLLARAHLCYLENQLDDAVVACHEVIVKDPKAVPAYKTLSLIHSARGEWSKALDLALIAAHLNPHDVDWWKYIASESVRMGKPRQAIHCLTKALSATRGHDEEALRERTYLFLQIGDEKRAAAGFEQLLRMEPADEDAVVNLARLYLKRGEAATAETLLTKWLDDMRRRERVRAGSSNTSALAVGTGFEQALTGLPPLYSGPRSATGLRDSARTRYGLVEPERRSQRPLLAHVRAQEALADSQLLQGKAAEVAATMNYLTLMLTAVRIARRRSRESTLTVSGTKSLPAGKDGNAPVTADEKEQSRMTCSNGITDPADVLPLRLRARLALAHLLLGDPKPAQRIGAVLVCEEQVPLLYFHDLLYHFRRILAQTTEHELEFAILQRLRQFGPYDQDTELRQRFDWLSRVCENSDVAAPAPQAPVKSVQRRAQQRSRDPEEKNASRGHVKPERSVDKERAPRDDRRRARKDLESGSCAVQDTSSAGASDSTEYDIPKQHTRSLRRRSDAGRGHAPDQAPNGATDAPDKKPNAGALAPDPSSKERKRRRTRQ